jgi:uncharacterized protein
MDILEKERKLEEYLLSLNSVVVAFSSGVDSTYLLKKASDVLKDKVIAVTVKLHSFPNHEQISAIQFCKENHIQHVIIDMNELEIEGFKDNPINRCYICKKHIFTQILKVKEQYHMNYVIEGSNIDDMSDYRPGLKAIEELNIISPLKEVSLTKDEIRYLSKKENLSTWDKPSFACLASRFEYGHTITKEKLKMVEEAENILLALGIHQERVRIHGLNARIEVNADEIFKIIENRLFIDKKFKELGFKYVSLDLLGYKTGNMNQF